MRNPETRPSMDILGSVRPRKSVLALGLGLAVLSLADPGSSAFAQSQPTDGSQLQSLVDELNAELERGEEKRLIDPWFLRDLRTTIGRYDNPWDTRIFEDNFSNQSSKLRAPWEVVSGEIVVDWRYGMRSVVQAPQEDEQTQASQESALGQIFGAILKQATKERQESTEPSSAKPAEVTTASALAPVTITNAFAIRLELTSRPLQGVEIPRFELGPYQGEGATAGYRLVLHPGQTTSLELTSVSTRGTVSTIELYDEPLKLANGEVHVIEWTRDRNGRTVIQVDGVQVMDVVDRRFSESFDGFALTNRGGDFALRSIRIDGTS